MISKDLLHVERVQAMNGLKGGEQELWDLLVGKRLYMK